MKLKDLGEFGLISRIRGKEKRCKGVVRGVGDDCAVIDDGGRDYLLVTQDMLTEEVHFRVKEAGYRRIGRKALGVSLSDIAAMAGRPEFYTLSLACPANTEVKAIDEFYRGLEEAASGYGVKLVGGDTSRAKRFVCDICLFGRVEKRLVTLRSGARIGDDIFVTGTLGGSRGKKEFCFTPRVKEARILVRNYRINSMIDISDGLSSDIRRIAEESGVGAEMWASRIPVARGAKGIINAISDGEDFELLFTAPAGYKEKDISRKLSLKVSRIGRIVPRQEDIVVKDKNGKKISAKRGFLHF